MFIKGALYKSLGIKVMHGMIPGDYPQTIADLSHRVKFEDNSFSGGGAHSDVYTKLTSSSKNHLGNSWVEHM